MAFSYDKSGLATSTLYRARFQLGDTNEASPLLDDDEISAMVDVYGYAEGVAQLADGLASRYAQDPDEYEDEGGVRVRWNQKIKVWQDLARRLRAGIALANQPTATAGPVSGSITGPDLTVGILP